MKDKFDKNKNPNIPDTDDTERFWKSAEVTTSRLKFNGVRMSDNTESAPKSRLSGTLSGTPAKSDVSKTDVNKTKESTGTGAFYSAGNLSFSGTSSPAPAKPTSKLIGTAAKSAPASSETKVSVPNVSVSKVSTKTAPTVKGESKFVPTDKVTIVSSAKKTANTDKGTTSPSVKKTSNTDKITIAPSVKKAAVTDKGVVAPTVKKVTPADKVTTAPVAKKAEPEKAAPVAKPIPKKKSKPSMNPETMEQYEKFHEKRAELCEIINDASKIASALNMKNFTDKLKTVSRKISGDSFKIQIVGNFKNGKSTFINSFLGENILPAYARPCTAVINEVKYGEEKRAVLHFKNPLPETLPEELSAEAANHIKTHASKKKIPPLEIPYDKIEEYVVIPMGKDPKDMILESPYEKVELYWPLDLLSNGIEIIDSPGLNEHATRTKVTMDYINKTDAIIFVLNATSLCSMDEMSFIKNNLKEQGFDDLFFVINRFDLIPENERERMKKFAGKQLSELTSFGDDGLFFVSAKQALDGKMTGNRELLEASGLIGLEKYLSDFLTKNRGQLKLSTPARSLGKILTDEVMGKIIPRQKDMLEIEIGDLRKRYSAIKPVLSKLENRKNRLYEKMLLGIRQNKTEFKILASENSQSIIVAIPEWVRTFEPRTKLGLFANQSKVKELADEISSHVSIRLEQSVMVWQKNQLVSSIKETASCIFGPAEKEIKQIMRDVRDAGNAVTGYREDSDAEHSDMSFDILSSLNNLSDNKEIAKSLAATTSGGSLTAFLSIANPVSIFDALSYMLAGANAQTNKIKDSVVMEMTANIRNGSSTFERSVVENVTGLFTDMADKMIAPVEEEIQETQNQIENAIFNMEKGGDVINKKRASLDACEKKIKVICTNINTFVSELSKI